MKILAPVDGSPPSLRAVNLAIELAAGRQQTSIVLLNVQNISMVALSEGARAVMAILLEEEEKRASAEALSKGNKNLRGVWRPIHSAGRKRFTSGDDPPDRRRREG